MKSKYPQVYWQLHKPVVSWVLLSSTEQLGMHFALNNAAVPWRNVTAHLYEEQISTGVFAATQACCQLGFAEQHRVVGNAFFPEQCCSALGNGHCTPA